jgi:hypothetical protein
MIRSDIPQSRPNSTAPLTVAWAREHHRPHDEWTIDVHTAQALKDADND